jgi:hypothetical protein
MFYFLCGAVVGCYTTMQLVRVVAVRQVQELMRK